MSPLLFVHVCPQLSPYCDTTSLEEALEEDPDFVVLASGTYDLHDVVVDVDNVVIKSEDPANPAVLRLDDAALSVAGAILAIEADGVGLQDLVFDGASPSMVATPLPNRAVIVEDASEVRIDNVWFTGFRWGAEGGSLAIRDADVTVSRSTFEDASSATEGGHISVRSQSSTAVLDLRDSTVRNAIAGTWGAGIAARNAIVDLSDVRFETLQSAQQAGHLWLQGGELHAEDVGFSGGGAPLWQTMAIANAVEVTMRRVSVGAPAEPGTGLVFIDNSQNVHLDAFAMPEIGSSTPGLLVDEGRLTIANSVFAGARGGVFAAVKIEFMDLAVVRESWFCDNEGDQGGLSFIGSCLGCEIRDSVFASNRDAMFVNASPPHAVALTGELSGELDVRRNTFGDNAYAGLVGVGSVLDVFADDVVVEQNLWINNVSNGPLTAIEANYEARVVNNAWVMGGTAIAGDVAPIVLSEVPRFVRATPSRTQPAACAGSWIPAVNSVPADLPPGAFTTDADEDGFIGAEDCDDGDPDVNPEAIETPGDGRDQDCDGWELCFVDADFDGWGTEPILTEDWRCRDLDHASRPGDCDDSDDLTNPDAYDDPADGIDRDCSDEPLEPGDDLDGDGVPVPEDCFDDDPDRVRCDTFFAGSPRCATGPGGASFLALLGLLVVAHRRQR